MAEQRISIMGAVLRMLLAVLALLAVNSPARADVDGDHDHGDGGGSTAVTIAPRVEARIGDKQLVLITPGGGRSRTRPPGSSAAPSRSSYPTRGSSSFSSRSLMPRRYQALSWRR